MMPVSYTHLANRKSRTLLGVFRNRITGTMIWSRPRAMLVHIDLIFHFPCVLGIGLL